MNWIERQIREVREKQLPELDLSIHLWHSLSGDSSDRLTEFPREILDFTWLETLNLRGHGLARLPPEISQLQSLQSLNVSVRGARSGSQPVIGIGIDDVASRFTVRFFLSALTSFYEWWAVVLRA